MRPAPPYSLEGKTERNLVMPRLARSAVLPVALAALLALLATPLLAQDRDAAALFDRMKLPQMIGVMQREGLDYGETLARDMLSDSPSRDWMETVATIYHEERMVANIRAEFVAGLEGADLAALHDFYGSPLGRELISLELSAREALLDDQVEEAARERAALAMADETDRYRLVSRFVDANDLVDRNVMGAMNSNYAFFLGLAEGGAFGGDMSEERILSDVWAQEPEIRISTTEWVYAFTLLAYQPLDDADLAIYTDFAETGPGQRINRALFEAFDGEFEAISRALGRAAAQEMASRDL